MNEILFASIVGVHCKDFNLFNALAFLNTIICKNFGFFTCLHSLVIVFSQKIIKLVIKFLVLIGLLRKNRHSLLTKSSISIATLCRTFSLRFEVLTRESKLF